MPLSLYRRHLKGCAVHKLDLPPRAKRIWGECLCPIWMCGKTDTARVPRQSTGYSDMTAAIALRDSLQAQGKDEKVHGPRLADCVSTYLKSRLHEVAEHTADQQELILGRFRDYLADHGIHFARHITVDVVESFKIDGLPHANTSRKTYTAIVRCFLRDALRRGWIIDPLADRVRPHNAAHNIKSPYTDAEVTSILDGALKLRGGKGRFTSHPATLKLLLELMLATGMRVGDAARYDPKAASRGESLWIYSYRPQKVHRGRPAKTVEAYLGDGLKKAIDGCHWLSPSLPFAFGSSRDTSYLSREVYDRMQSIGTHAGVADCRPHRLRDTFAVRALLRGVSLDDVSRLLGHSSVKVTEAYYTKWVPARGRRLERVVAESLVHSLRD